MIATPPEYAFPHTERTTTGEVYYDHLGLTKREWMATMCLQGLLACPEVRGNEESLANSAVGFADALMRRLSKPLEDGKP